MEIGGLAVVGASDVGDGLVLVHALLYVLVLLVLDVLGELSGPLTVRL